MTFRYLIGPVTAEFARNYLEADRRAGRCLAFHASEPVDLQVSASDSWQDLRARFPAGWEPDLLVLYLPYNAIPQRLAEAPVPVVGLAPGWNLLWHTYQHHLPLCDRVLTDRPGVSALQRAWHEHVREANLFGLGRDLADRNWTDGPRDIDILFVGNFQPSLGIEHHSVLQRAAIHATLRREHLAALAPPLCPGAENQARPLCPPRRLNRTVDPGVSATRRRKVRCQIDSNCIDEHAETDPLKNSSSLRRAKWVSQGLIGWQQSCFTAFIPLSGGQG